MSGCLHLLGHNGPPGSRGSDEWECPTQYDPVKGGFLFIRGCNLLLMPGQLTVVMRTAGKMQVYGAQHSRLSKTTVQPILHQPMLHSNYTKSFRFCSPQELTTRHPLPCPSFRPKLLGISPKKKYRMKETSLVSLPIPQEGVSQLAPALLKQSY